LQQSNSCLQRVSLEAPIPPNLMFVASNDAHLNCTYPKTAFVLYSIVTRAAPTAIPRATSCNCQHNAEKCTVGSSLKSLQGSRTAHEKMQISAPKQTLRQSLPHLFP
jgi:hypothetical protein